jgi:hypothetical protein
MKNWILRASTLAFAAGLVGTLACGGSSSGCGGSNINANDTGGTTLQMSCGSGTYLNNNQCIPIPTSSGSGSSATTTKVITN